MATIRRFEDIQAWWDARTLCAEFYKAWNADLKFSRDFELLNQMKRSSGSVMDNIAEGFGRGSRKEFIYFLGVSMGSCAEFRSQLYRAIDQGYIDKRKFDELYQNADAISAKISRFINYLNSVKTDGLRYKVEEPPADYEPDVPDLSGFSNN